MLIFYNIIIGLLDSESIVTSDIASRLLNIFDSNQIGSIQRRFRRLFSNPNVDIYSIYDTFISHFINHFHFNHSDHRIHIPIDHMFCKNQFTVLCFTLRIGRQGIPIWFRCFKGMSNPNTFQLDLLKDSFVIRIRNNLRIYKYEKSEKLTDTKRTKGKIKRMISFFMISNLLQLNILLCQKIQKKH